MAFEIVRCFSRPWLFSYKKDAMLLPVVYRRGGVVVRASASQSVDWGFITQVESYQKILENGIHSFPAWRSAQYEWCGDQAGKLACCVLGQGT